MDETLKGYGYFLKAITTAMEENSGGSVRLNDTEFDNFTRFPKSQLAIVMRKASIAGLTAEDEERIADALAMVARDYPKGDKSKPMGSADVANIMLAYMHYDLDQMTVADAAEELGVSVQAVYKMLDDGKLNGIKGARGRRVFRSSLDGRKRD